MLISSSQVKESSALCFFCLYVFSKMCIEALFLHIFVSLLHYTSAFPLYSQPQSKYPFRSQRQMIQNPLSVNSVDLSAASSVSVIKLSVCNHALIKSGLLLNTTVLKGNECHHLCGPGFGNELSKTFNIH
jgi:hypothetical protein